MAIIGEFEVAARAVDPDAEPDQFKFCGEVFTIADKIGVIPLGRFAKAAMSGLDTAEMEGMAAMVDMLCDAVVDEDRDRFLQVCTQNRADGDDLMPVVQAVFEVISGRPTRQLSDSSGGLSITGVSSKAASSSEVQDPRQAGLVSVEQAALSLVS